MAVNVSSSLNTFQHCFQSRVGVSIIAVFIVTKVFVLPLSLLVFYLGFQKWRQQRSFATTSHSDIFTYYSAAVELIYTLGAVFYFCGHFTCPLQVVTVGIYLCAVVVPGETFFHILTCVERYLAVVHPVTYLRLRQSGGVRIRNISIACVWLLCCGWMCVTALYYPDPPYIPYFCVLGTSLVVVSFCSIFVLCVLIRPGPGEMDRDRARLDKSKQRAFYTIIVILGVLWLFFLGILVCIALHSSHTLSFSSECTMLLFGNFVTLPSGLVLPLLFLHRAGRLHCCRSSSK